MCAGGSQGADRQLRRGAGETQGVLLGGCDVNELILSPPLQFVTLEMDSDCVSYFLSSQ